MHPFLHFRSLLINLTLAATLIIGCKGSDPAPATELPGSYKVTGYMQTVGAQTTNVMQLLATSGITCFQDVVINLKADGTFSNNDPASCTSVDLIDGLKDGKWFISGNTLSFWPYNKTHSDWTYTLAGNKLALSASTTYSTNIPIVLKIEWTKQ